jgi:hypothetical protein
LGLFVFLTIALENTFFVSTWYDMQRLFFEENKKTLENLLALFSLYLQPRILYAKPNLKKGDMI